MNTENHTAIGAEVVDQKLVHKKRIENVLISNLRRPLPQNLSVDTVENEIFPACSDREKTIFDKYYKKFEKKNEFRLLAINNTLPIVDMKKRFQSHDVTKSDMRFFLKFYRKRSNEQVYYLFNTPDDNEDLRLCRIIEGKSKKTSDREKSILSDLLSKDKINSEGKIFYSNMIVDTNHYYFFEHPNEHVPGMMLIEAVRQLLVAITHKYGKVPLSGYNFVLSSMKGIFKSYLELNYPILIKVIVTDLHAYESGIWADSNFETHVYQNEKEAAVISFQENVITNRVFKRLRSSSESTARKTWFILKSNVEYDIILRKKDVERFTAQIEYISYEGCMFIIDTKQGIAVDTLNFDAIEFFMYFSKVGFVHGTGKMKIENHVGSFMQTQLYFTKMEKLDKNNLHEVIKKYGYALIDGL